MANSNGVITAPIRLAADVAYVLGESTLSVSALCKSTKINQWSRCKPVHINTPFPDRSMPADGKGAWWLGSNGNAGIKVPPVVSFEDIPGSYTSDKSNGWTYERPRGGSDSPYRLADFLNYYHDARPPFSGFSSDSKATPSGSIACSVGYSFDSADKSGPGSVQLSDLQLESNLATWYFGVMLVDSSNRIVRKLANVKPGYILYMPASGLTLEQYYDVYPFICRNQIPDIYTPDSMTNLYLPIMNCAPGRVQIVTEEALGGLVFKLTASYTTHPMTGMIESVDWTMTLRATLGNMTLANNYICLRFATSNENDSMLIGEQQQRLDDIYLTMNVERTFSGSFIPSNKLQEYYVYVTLDSGKYKKKTFAFQPVG